MAGQDIEITVSSLRELENVAIGVAERLKGGEIIGLVGDLGAGKTAFTQKLAKALGINKAVRSPTFILMQCFNIGSDYRKKTGINELCHVDAYRLKDEDELFAIGFGEYAEREDAVTVVEWADRIESVSWLEDYREIRFAFGEGEERVLTCDNRIIG